VGLREFTRAESITLLGRLAPGLTAPEADRVADAVGDLPLAIEQTGSLLADTGMTADKYLRLLAERAQDVLDYDPGGTYPQSLAGSWAVAFDRLAADDPTALDLLTVLAWCGPEPVPLPLLADHPGCPPRLAAADRRRPAGVGALHRDPAPAGHGHGVPARPPAAPGPGGAATRPQSRTHGPDGTAAAGWAARAVRLLDHIAPGRVRIDPSGWPVWRLLLPHVLAAAGHEAALDAAPAEATRLLDPRTVRLRNDPYHRQARSVMCTVSVRP
jgi:hypothetical protein